MFFHVSSSSLRQWFATLSCSLGSGLTASSVMAYNSILVESLQKDPDTNFTFEETSWFCKKADSFVLEIQIHISASCWAFTAILGCFVGGIISDMAGRRKVIIISVIPFIIGSIMVTKLNNFTIKITAMSQVAHSSSLGLILLSRCLAGLGDGMLFPNVLGSINI